MVKYILLENISIETSVADPDPDPLVKETDLWIRIRYQNVTNPQH